MSFRNAMKGTVERMLVASGAPRAARRAFGGRHLVLAYHNVVPDADAESRSHPLHLGLSRFRRQLDMLEEHAEVVPLEAITPGPGADPDPPGIHRPRVSLTFDDGYAGMLEVGVPELVSRGLPATVFVCPGLLAEPAFWWDVVDASGHDAQLFHTFEGKQDRVLAWAARAHRLHPEGVTRWRRPASRAELTRALASAGGLLLAGAHGWDHPNLAALDPDALRDQLERPLRWVTSALHPTTRWIAYPYGFSSGAVRAAARRAGYGGGLEIAGGWVPATGGDRWATPRVSIPAALSDEGFLLRISGLLRR